MKNIKVEPSFNGYYIRIDGKQYFLSIPTSLQGMKVVEYLKDNSQGEEVELKQSQLLEIMTQIFALKHKSIGGSMCQLIESWGSDEKTEKARKCIMWQQLEKYIN